MGYIYRVSGLLSAEIGVFADITLKKFNLGRTLVYEVPANTITGLGYPAFGGSSGQEALIASAIWVLKGSDEMGVSASTAIPPVKALTIKVLTTLPAPTIK